MAKDPAFLFYAQDFLVGCSDLTLEERGQYITMLCLQHQKGFVTEKTIRLTVGSVSVDVLNKFVKDENGNYYNERLLLETQKREAFVESRRLNGMLGGRPKKASGKPSGKPIYNLHEDENENVIDNTIDHLNDVCNTSYKPTTSETVRLIGGRVGDGYVLNDFKKVIDCMAEKWLDDDEMSQYLRPSTLFRPSKFEGYLQQANRASNSKKHPFADCKCGFNFQLRPNDIEDARKKPCPKCGGKVEIIYA
jgi:uncharacterized phage protein (TIGR02220 family)